MTNDSVVSAPERLQTWIDAPDGKRLPFSCTLAVLKANTDIGDVIEFTVLSLKAGAGVKLIIDPSFRLPEPQPNFKVEVQLKKGHKDWEIVPFEEASLANVIYPKTFADLYPFDSIESITHTWRELTSLNQNEVLVDLSELRPRDSVNSDGLLASGPLTFAAVYHAIAHYRRSPSMHTLLKMFGVLNAVILRGGYKKGIITSACHDQSPYYQEYLKVPLVSLRGSHKKGVILTEYPNNVEQLCELVNYESLFLQKQREPGLYANVCQGILLEDRGTCLINRINLGRLPLDNLAFDIPFFFRTATRQAIDAHVTWRQQQPERAKQWANLENDNQVAIDVMGLANLLRRMGISYDLFIATLRAVSFGCTVPTDTKVFNLISALREAYKSSVRAADKYCYFLGVPNMERLHTIEPAQAHSYRTTDLEGFTTCRGIWPPFSQHVNRYSHSTAEPVATYNHGEIEQITPEQQFRLCEGWQQMINECGKPHTISYDTWINFDQVEFDKWYGSDLETLYYNMAGDYATRTFARKKYDNIELCSACTD